MSEPPGVPAPPGGWIEVDPPSEPTPPPPPAPTPTASESSIPPPPPPPDVGPPSGGRRDRRWLFVVIALVVVAGAVAAVALRPDDGSDATSDTAAEEDEEREEGEEGEPPPTHPDAWDPRVAPLIEFVEAERDLTFEHPVTVEFLDEAAWREQADIDEEEILDEDAQLLEHGAGLFRAVGLAEGELDLLSDSEELSASGTVGHYDFEDEVVRIRGTQLTPKIESTLVHELTHVLQDQHFDIGARLEAVADEDTDEESLRVVVEGDADRIEEIWEEGLSDEEQEALDEERAAESTTAGEALSELPESLVTFFASSYILGTGFMDILEAADGVQAIDDAFETPPDPDEHVYDPIAFLDGDEESVVEPPEVDGEPIEDMDGAFGAVSLYLMLAERIDPLTALAAVDGWGGDQFVAYTADDRTCAAMRFVGEDTAASSSIEAALAEWAAAMPAEADVTIDADDDQIDVVSCDPGAAADLLPEGGRSQETISLIAIRSELASQVLEGGASTDQARCFSRGTLADLDYDLLIASETTVEQQAEINRVVAEQAAACR